MRRSLVGRADLLVALKEGGVEAQAAVARMLGLSKVPTTESRFEATEPKSPEAATPIEAPLVERGDGAQLVVSSRESFWMPTELTLVDAGAEDGQRHKPLDIALVPRERPEVDVSFRPLAPVAQVLSRVRQYSGFLQAGHEIDWPEVVRQVGLGRDLISMPRRRRRRWGHSLVVILDRSRHLVPYWEDELAVLSALEEKLPKGGGVEVLYRNGASGDWLARWTGSGWATVEVPENQVVLALSDLGCLENDPEAGWRRWQHITRRLAEGRNRLAALVPWGHSPLRHEVARHWSLTGWEPGERGVSSSDAGEAAALRVLALLWYVQRLEPQLVRAVRRLIPEGRDPGIEAKVWQHRLLASRHVDAGTLSVEAGAELASLGQNESDELLQAVRRVVSAQRQSSYCGIEYIELAALGAELERQGRSRDTLVPDSQMREALAWIKRAAELAGDVSATNSASEAMRQWFSAVLPRMPESARQRPEIRDALHGVSEQLGLVEKPCAIQMYEHGDEWRFVPDEARPSKSRGNYLASITSQNRLLVVEPVVDDFWQGGPAPPWATDWGRDKHGAWAEFQVRGVTQRLRWIPPGSFQMGSPAAEKGRDDDEGPVHRVTISRGFWLADTACTQQLWSAVMGNNPSRFRGDDRPVDQTTWHDADSFCSKLRELISDFDAALPTESQWEYACRAGTMTPFWFGANVTTDEANYDGNYPYAGAKKEKYRHQTLGVKELPAGGWGLFQMHGNVYEWCRDGKRQYRDLEELDPVGPMSSGLKRVLRGGSWNSRARYVRCAYRGAGDTSNRSGFIGFRLAGVPQSGQGVTDPEGGGAQRAVSASQPAQLAEQGGDREQASEARTLRVSGSRAAQAPRASIASVNVLSDCERLQLQRFGRPEWASAFGRDRFGLWSEFTVAGVVQRLRWIPPGRFLMGSPEDEPGRYSSEGPRHEVVISCGFWLGDTPCTQSLWQAVMGKNPSHFKTPNRPVDSVRWDDCQEFLERLDKRVAGIGFTLPTEAEWEYACRAGTTTTTYDGGIEIFGDNCAPALHEIAWYGGNSGVEFELADGESSSGWPEKQFDHKRAGSRIVAQKKANCWGLFDMLGNVYEWCRDGRRQFDAESVLDPVGPDASGVLRVLRGGSWASRARHVRCAHWLSRFPSVIYDDFGFRIAGVTQSGSKREVTSERKQVLAGRRRSRK